MSEYLINSSTLTGIADAVRGKVSTSETFTPAQMISEIENINARKTAIMPRTYRSSQSVTSYIGNEGYILDNAFQSCTNLLFVSFSNCIAIENYAFDGCSQLISIYFPNCQYIGWSAFQQCSSLLEASFPDCTVIDGRAFRSCSSLITAYFPKCSGKIGGYAFADCSLLSSLYLDQVSSVPLVNSDSFNNSPLSAGGTGKIYVPSSLYTAFTTAANWSLVSARIVSV